MRLYLNQDNPPSLLLPTRIIVFATTQEHGKRRKVVTRSVAWEAWNTCPIMESQMARLRGSGSFYWPSALRAYLHAKQIMAANSSVDQIKIETISGEEIARLYRA